MGTQTKKQIIKGCVRFILFSLIMFLGFMAFVLFNIATEGINFYGVH